MELACPAEGRYGVPDAAGANRACVLGKSSVELRVEGQRAGGGAAETGKNTKGGGIGGNGDMLEGFEGELKPPVGRVAEAAGRLK